MWFTTVCVLASVWMCLISTGEAIDCYQCVSANNTDEAGKACRNPFNQWNVPYVKNCHQHIAGHSQEAFACVQIVQRIEETGQESIIRDCIAVPMKQGCERRQMSNYKLYGGPAHTVTQCVYVCHDYNGCNSANHHRLSLLMLCLTFLFSVLAIKSKFLSSLCV